MWAFSRRLPEEFFGVSAGVEAEEGMVAIVSVAGRGGCVSSLMAMVTTEEISVRGEGRVREGRGEVAMARGEAFEVLRFRGEVSGETGSARGRVGGRVVLPLSPTIINRRGDETGEVVDRGWGG